ncbi:MAG TPA: hypothetical protein VGN01_19040 [Acidobacteriaceae bacterium]|jgi:hypothetical protein
MVRTVAGGSLLIALTALSGCGVGSSSQNAIKAITPAVKASGSVHGGQQPVTGAVMQLWAVGTTGMGSAATPLIGATVTTSDGTGVANSNANAGNANNTLAAGNFTITGDYTCPTASTLVYLTATGGNPGLTAGTNNSALVLLAPLGQCGALSSSTFVSINEVTTVGAAFALAPFIANSGSIGAASDSASQQALANGFASVNNLVNTSSGAALTLTTGGLFVPQVKIDTLANVLVPCVNSTGPTSANCVALFTDATPSGGSAPTTILGAIVDIALNPTNNVTALFNLSQANAAFQPSSTSAPAGWNVIIGSSTTTACGYAGGGNNLSGTISYSGSKTGRIYIAVNNINGCDVGTQGTSISAAGTYTIHGVPPGTYTVQAFMDTLGYGAGNAANPSGTSSSFSASAVNVTAPTLTLTDPATPTITSSPNLNEVGAFNTGAIALFDGVKNNGVEQATSYTLQWSTTSAFTTVAGSQIFPAIGTNTNVWVVKGLTNSSVYYFRAYGTSAGTAVGPYSSVFGPVTIGAPSAGSTVSGTVSFTGAATGPLYVGFYNQNNSAVPPYLQYIANPVSLQAYSVNVPNSATAVYLPVGIIDQNNDGVVDAGDIVNINYQSSPISVTGPTANQNITLPTGNSLASVSTKHFLSGSTHTYAIYFSIPGANKLPVAISLLPSSNADGANITSGPMDIASCAVPPNTCRDGNTGFQMYFSLGSNAPTTGDTYLLKITYSDATTETVAATVTNVLSTFATSLAPTTGTSVSTTPTFTWTDPVCGACSNYTYTFELDGAGNQIWYVPGNGNGLAPGTTSVAWGVDPSNASNTPSVGSLTLGTTYSWSVTVQDGDFNSATTTVSYQP